MNNDELAAAIVDAKIQDDRGNCIGVVRKAIKDKMALYCLSDAKFVLQLKRRSLSAICPDVIKPKGTRLCWASWPSIKAGLRTFKEPSPLIQQFLDRRLFEVPDPQSIDIEFKKSPLAKEIDKLPDDQKFQVLIHIYDAVKCPERFKRIAGEELFEFTTIKRLFEFSAIEFAKMIAPLIEKQEAKMLSELDKATKAAPQQALQVAVPKEGKGIVSLTINLNFA